MTRQMSPFDGLSSDPGAGSFGYDNPDRALCQYDPKLYLSNLAVALSPAEGSAKAAMMAWLVELPDGTDPARAASRLLSLPLFSGIAASDGEAGVLVSLLDQVRRFPRHKLAAMPRRGRRRPHLHA